MTEVTNGFVSRPPGGDQEETWNRFFRLYLLFRYESGRREAAARRDSATLPKLRDQETRKDGLPGANEVCPRR